MKETHRHSASLALLSWAVFATALAGLIVYMIVHAQSLLDSDMSSELILAKQLAQSGRLLSDNWYYSTEIRILNTQVVYALFFRFMESWRLVRILGNITLYFVLLSSYYFFCRRLDIARSFPITAAIMLLPLSSDYYYILLYGAYYIPRISMMFIILGLLLPTIAPARSKASALISLLVLGVLSFALGLEGPRMVLILFIPLAVLFGCECICRSIPNNRLGKGIASRLALSSTRPPLKSYATRAFVVCLAGMAGYLLNATVLSNAYSFEHVNLSFDLTAGRIKGTVFNQIHSIGDSSFTYAISLLLWTLTAVLCVVYLLRKAEKQLAAVRYVCFCLVTWAGYTAVSCTLSLELATWHFIPVAILFIPCAALVIGDLQMRPLPRRLLAAGIGACILILGALGYHSFADWPLRNGARSNVEFARIAKVLKSEGFESGYGTFWNANILTELTDGEIDVWCVNTLDAKTATDPDLYRWLQVRSHDDALPEGKTFVICTIEEYLRYHVQTFDYVGNELYRSDAFVVFAVAK